jgi:integrase
VVVPVADALKKALQVTPKRRPMMHVDELGMPWVPKKFQNAWHRATVRAGLSGITFNDLRGTFVTRAALKGASEAQIAAVTGHNLKDVRNIMDAHYLHRDPELGVPAIKKLEGSQ